MTHILKKAIFPVAGLGTRFLPATKANPKEMLPIIDKPLIQYAVEEAIAAGLTELIFVTNYSKHTIQEHFDPNHELESTLEQRGQLDLLKVVHDILPPGITCTYIHQPNALGLGHAILCAKDQIANEPFAVLLADDLISNGAQGCLHEMASIFTETGSNVIALEKVSLTDTAKYGIVELQHTAENYHPISSIVEKPAPENAPSNLAVVGRYILHPSILKALEATHSDNHNEIQLTDAISQILKEETVYGYYLTGTRYDCGSKLGYLQDNVSYALHHPEIATEFKAYLRQLHERYFEFPAKKSHKKTENM